MHWPERYVPKWGESQYRADKAAEDRERETAALQGFDAVVRSMGALLEAGKIKAWGLSNETSFGVGAFAAACARLGVAPPVSIQNDFSLCFRTFEGELAEACSPDHHNLALLAYGVLNGGILSGKYLGARHPALANATKAAAPPAPEPRARFNFVASDEVGMPDYQVSRTRTETLSLSLTLTRWVRAACPASRWPCPPNPGSNPYPYS